MFDLREAFYQIQFIRCINIHSRYGSDIIVQFIYVYKNYLLRHLDNCKVKVALDVKNEWYIRSRLYHRVGPTLWFVSTTNHEIL